MYNKHKEDCVVIALDAEKAFDHIEWQFMLSTLNRFGFGSSFINWITIIYCQPQASIINNGEISQPFNLQRGVRQGCSCSPHLFNLCIEVLACLIRANPNYKPIQLNGKDHHLSLFADDITLYISHPRTMLPTLLHIIKEFGSLSGYTVNWEKSDETDFDFLHTMPFKIVDDQIKCLGIIATRKYSNLLKSNWDTKIQQLRHNIDFWNMLPISLIGRVNVIKMVTLPRFLYIFQCLPVYIPICYF